MTLARLRPWIALMVAPAAWALHHQFGSDANYAACDKGQPLAQIAVGALAFLLVLAGSVPTLAVWRAGDADARQVDRFIATLGLLAAGLFGLTILVQTLAAIILPPCFR